MHLTEVDPPAWVLELVGRWRPLVGEVIYEYGYKWPITDDLVLAIIAQESFGLPDAVSRDEWESVGLMQVVPKPWVGTAEVLMDPRYNIEWGIWFLDQAFKGCGGVTVCALRVYNCGPDRVAESDSCGSYYADRVLNYWLPNFLDREPMWRTTNEKVCVDLPYYKCLVPACSVSDCW